MYSSRHLFNNSMFNPTYKGKIKAVIADWSGTICDAGVLAPSIGFINIFYKYGINIYMSEVREQMGLRKDIHIKELLFNNLKIRNQWITKYKKEPTLEDVKMIFSHYVPVQLDCLRPYSKIIDGADSVTQLLHSQNIKIGCTTGFIKCMSDFLLKEVRKQGVHMDCAVSGNEVLNGIRPSPFMLYKNLEILNINNIQSVIKVDDTSSGIKEGLNAGCWTVGVSKWSNYCNYNSLEHMLNSSQNYKDRRETISRNKLMLAGAHYVISDITLLPNVISDINNKLECGIQPTDLSNSTGLSAKGMNC